MTIEALINSLSTDEKLAAMDLLWRDLSANAHGRGFESSECR